jgi:hypothetical protein
MFRTLFVDHPQQVGETYAQHARASSRIGLRMIVGGLACCVHAIVPGLFVKTGSTSIRRLYADIQPRKTDTSATATAAAQEPAL